MLSVDVTLGNSLLNELRAQLAAFAGKNGGEIAPATSAAVETAAKIIQDTWRGWAKGESIEGADDIRKANSRLAASITVRRNGSLDAEIGTDSPYMKRIQQGSPEYDMKKTYPYGRKSRVSKREGHTSSSPLLGTLQTAREGQGRTARSPTRYLKTCWTLCGARNGGAAI